MYKVGTFFDMTVTKGARCFLEIVTLKVLLFKNISVTFLWSYIFKKK